MKRHHISGIILDGHYRLLRPLGKAGGAVESWLAADLNTADATPAEEPMDASTALPVVVKLHHVAQVGDGAFMQHVRQEFRTAYGCRHSHLLTPTQLTMSDGVPCVVMPYCRNGSAENLIGMLTDEDEMWKFIHDVVSGLEHLHGMKPAMVHQDMKPSNVLIDDSGNFALSDFGVSALRQVLQLSEDDKSSHAYTAPECFDTDSRQPASDIYAFGAMLYELLTGNVPFGEQGGSAQPDGAVRLPYVNHEVPADVKRLVAACLNKNPHRRPTATELVQAAEKRSFFPKWHINRKSLVRGLLIIAVIGAVILGLTIDPRPKTEPGPEPQPEPIVNTDSLYNIAIDLVMNDDNIVEGIRQLDYIAKKYDYMDAYYNIGMIYGMIVMGEDTVDIKKKHKVLGINYITIKIKDLGKFETYQTPVDSAHMVKSHQAFSKTITIADSIIRNNPNGGGGNDYYREKMIYSLYAMALQDYVVFRDTQLAIKELQQCDSLAQIIKQSDKLEVCREMSKECMYYIERFRQNPQPEFVK